MLRLAGDKMGPKKGFSKNGKEMHYAVGAVIRKDGKYLLVDRVHFPLGFAGVAGHIDEGENEIEALKREVFEESGLKVLNYKLLYEEEVPGNECHYGIKTHYWYLFECECEGSLKISQREAKSIGFYSKDELKKLNLDPVWKYWFSKLGILE